MANKPSHFPHPHLPKKPAFSAFPQAIEEEKKFVKCTCSNNEFILLLFFLFFTFPPLGLFSFMQDCLLTVNFCKLTNTANVPLTSSFLITVHSQERHWDDNEERWSFKGPTSFLNFRSHKHTTPRLLIWWLQSFATPMCPAVMPWWHLKKAMPLIH